MRRRSSCWFRHRIVPPAASGSWPASANSASRHSSQFFRRKAAPSQDWIEWSIARVHSFGASGSVIVTASPGSITWLEAASSSGSAIEFSCSRSEDGVLVADINTGGTGVRALANRPRLHHAVDWRSIAMPMRRRASTATRCRGPFRYRQVPKSAKRLRGAKAEQVEGNARPSFRKSMFLNIPPWVLTWRKS